MRTVEEIKYLIENINGWTDEEKSSGTYLFKIKHLEIELKNTMAYHKGFGVNRDEIRVDQVREKLQWYIDKVEKSEGLMNYSSSWQIPDIWKTEIIRLQAELNLMEAEFDSIDQKD